MVTGHPVEAPRPLALLPFYCPFEAAIHPEAEDIERRCIEWMDHFRLYLTPEGRTRLVATKAAEVYARALPTAPADRVVDVAKWLYWGFATDDLLYDAGPSSVSAADFLRLGVVLVRICEEPRSRFEVEPPFTDALRDLVVAVTRHASPSQKTDWVDTARAWFFGMAWDVGNAERNTPPSVNDYLAMRMHTGGLASWITTLGIANGSELTAREATGGKARALGECWQTFALLINDLESYTKERRNGENSGNIVSVVAAEQGCPTADAVLVAHGFIDRMATLFLELRRQLLVDASPEMATFLVALEHSWRAIIDWGFTSARYVSDDGQPGAPVQPFPGWLESPRDTSLSPLLYPTISWWWDEINT
jgi:hypothetical protein